MRIFVRVYIHINHHCLRVLYPETCTSTRVSSFYPVLLLNPLRHAHRITLRARG